MMKRKTKKNTFLANMPPLLNQKNTKLNTNTFLFAFVKKECTNMFTLFTVNKFVGQTTSMVQKEIQQNAKIFPKNTIGFFHLGQ
jgi:hypothetical protein